MNTQQTIEAILFTAGKAVGLVKLAKLVGISKQEAEDAVAALDAQYKAQKRGLAIIRNEKEVELVSSPDTAETVSAFLKDETTGELTRPSLETLTIIAYRGPVAKSEIELIRGVNCSLILRNLRMRGLIEEELNDSGIEIYSVSLNFLKFLGISSVKELPEFDRLSSDERLNDLLENENWFKSTT